MGHRAGGYNLFYLQRDGVCFINAHPNREDSASAGLLQDHNWHVRNRIHHQTPDFHLNFHGLLLRIA